MGKEFQALKEKSDAELRGELRDVQRALFGLRANLAYQGTEHTANVTKLRREIARIKTLQSQRRIGAGANDKAAATEAREAKA